MTATTDRPPLSDTGRALLAACVEQPECDAVRLAFADWLDENPLPGRECSQCKRPADAKNWVTGHIFVGWGHGWQPCSKCDAMTLVPDDLHERWAELIRVQCELARTERSDLREIEFVDGTVSVKPSPNPRWGELVAREAALLPTLRARLMPKCPPEPHGCDGKLTPQSQAHCNLCKNSGVCPGTLVRGLSVCDVPLAAVGREDRQLCMECNRRAYYGRGRGLIGGVPCKDCKTVFQSTPWAIGAKAAGAMFQPSDVRVGNYRTGDGKPWGFEIGSRPGTIPQCVSAVLWAHTDGRQDGYPTEPTALSALSLALNRLVTRPAT